jgi:hypothetical protein
MAQLFREQKLSAGLWGRGVWRALQLALAVLLLLATGSCDIVQGFQQAGDTLFPEQKTYLAAPGVRLLGGGYRELGLAVGADIFLLARGGDDTTGKLFSMRYADPQPCQIPSVGRYAATRNLNRHAPIISYFNEDINRSTLRFADVNCNTFELSFSDALLPIAETDSSLVVWAGTDLWLATPEIEQQEKLAANVEDVLRGALGNNFIVRSAGTIALFASDWTPRGVFGSQVSNVRLVGKSAFYEDSAGVHQLLPSSTLGVQDLLVAADGCRVGSIDGVWVTFRSPCSGGPVVALHEPTGNQFTLSFDADPQQLWLIPARQSPGLDPTKDPFWFFGMRDGGDEDSRDTLVVKAPAGNEFTLGAHSTLQKLEVQETADETHGYAIVDLAPDGSGRYLWWDAQGQTKQLAEHVLSQTSRLIVDYDGSLGKLAVASGDRLLVLESGVPWPSFEYRDSTQAWTVLFHDLSLPGQPGEQNGQLSVFYGTLDALEATPVDRPLTAPELSSIAPSAAVFRVSALGLVLSGVIYLADFDPKSGTGQLDYRNLDLRFTAHVSPGVSDYLVVQDQVLYAVPRGDNAGIWLVSGK